MKIKEYNVTATATDGSERDLLSPNIQQAEHRASEYKQLGYKNIKITPIYEKEKSKQKRKKFLGVFQKGAKIKSHIYKRGTKIEAMSYDKIINEIDNAHPTDATLINQTIDETTKKGKINTLQKMDLKKYWFDKFGETINESIKNEKQYEKNYAKHEFESAKNKLEKIDLNEIDKNELRRDYPKKNAQWIWDNWTHEQRSHFLYDHDLDSTSNWNKNYDELNDVIKNALKTHIKQGRYEHGTKIESQKYTARLYGKFPGATQYEIVDVLEAENLKELQKNVDEFLKNRTKLDISDFTFHNPKGNEIDINTGEELKMTDSNERNENYYENVVNELLNDNAIATIRMKTYGCEIQPYSPVDDAYMLPIKLTRSDLLALIIKSNVEFMNYDEKQIVNELTQMTKLLMKK